MILDCSLFKLIYFKVYILIDIKLLGVFFDKNLTSEKHNISSTACSIAQKVRILRQRNSIYDSQSIVHNY